MANFLKNKSKWIILTYAIILSLVLLYALVYMTNFADVHVYYSKNTDGVISFSAQNTLTINSSQNGQLFKYFQNLAVNVSTGKTADYPNPLYSLIGKHSGGTTFVDSGLAQIVYDFQTDMSEYNDQLIVYFCVCIVLFACMLIASNQSRKVYYISNLVVGITVPLAVTVYTIIMMVKNFALMGTFNDNVDLFKAVAYLQDQNVTVSDKVVSYKDWSQIEDATTSVNSTVFIIGTILFIVLIVYSVLLIVYTVYRYKECSKRRAEIIERAAKAND